MKPLYKLAIGVAALAALSWAVKCGYDRSTVQQSDQKKERKADAKAVDSTTKILVTDTIRLHHQMAISDTLRRNLVLTDTVRVRREITQDSITIAACVEVQHSCAATIAARDKEIADLKKPLVTPRLSFTVDGLYDPVHRSLTARAGPEYRLFWGLSLKAEGEFTAGTAYSGTLLRVGIHKQF